MMRLGVNKPHLLGVKTEHDVYSKMTFISMALHRRNVILIVAYTQTIA